VSVVATRALNGTAKADPQSLERGVRQILADKVCGAHLGLWLLVPEHLRLGTWDLLLGWAGQAPERVEPRLALQLVHEATLCVAGLRAARSLPQASFGLLQGLPFLASDLAIHQLLGAHTVGQAQQLQAALGLRRRALGDYAGKVLVIDPHRFRSHSKRRMRKHRKEPKAQPAKVVQTFFAIDGDTSQPVCFTIGTASRTVTQATPELLGLAGTILGPQPTPTLALADAEHFSIELIQQIQQRTPFDLLVPLVVQPPYLERLRQLPAEQFTRRWVGYATLRATYTSGKPKGLTLPLLVQRFGEPPGECKFNAFLSTGQRDELEALTDGYPKRWHAEEFFNREQSLGWERAGTQNLNIRYGHMTLALLAQAVLRRLRLSLGETVATWDARHLAKDVLQGLEGDVRVSGATIVVTYYNAPNAEVLRSRYEGLPEQLRREGLDPKAPWLYGYELDFRFR
jgi:Transposase DDE domain